MPKPAQLILNSLPQQSTVSTHSISPILQESAGVTYTYAHDPPPSLFVHASFVAIRFWLFQGIQTGLQRWEFDVIITMLQVTGGFKFYNSFIATTTVQDCSRIYPLGGLGRHVWQTVRHLTMKAGWWDAHLALRDLAMSILRDICDEGLFHWSWRLELYNERNPSEIFSSEFWYRFLWDFTSILKAIAVLLLLHFDSCSAKAIMIWLTNQMKTLSN